MGEIPPETLPDPFALVSDQLRPLDSSLHDLVGSDHPVLMHVAQHFFELAGKRFRPTLVLLAARAANEGRPADAKQQRLSEITEMIHAASLLHDDVLDLADARRSAKAAHRIYGNKVAVLAGDFLLARASVLLSQLDDVRAVEMLATAIEEMVMGELMREKALADDLLALEHYESRTYRKTAALTALSCRAGGVLAAAPDGVEAALLTYGRHLGTAYQIVDDLLDFTRTAELPAGAAPASEHALVGAPTIFAAAQAPEIVDVVQRRFADEGDAATVVRLVERTDGLRRTRELATAHARKAADALGALAPSDAREALLRLCFDVLNRKA